MAIINGTGSADTITGTLQDQINGHGGNDKIVGSAGDDIITGGKGDDVIDGSAGNDVIYGDTGNDIIIDGAGDDQVFAGEGDDTMVASAGNDRYEGGLGFDTLDFSEATSGVTVDMNRGTASGFATGNDTFKDIEKIVGTAYADNIKGSAGNDVIVAGDGNNVIRGGQGSDEIILGGDSDTIVFKSWDVVDSATGASRGVDTIHGFNSGNDSLDLRSLLSQNKGVDYKADLDSFVHLTDTADGTMVQVNLGKGFVDVALLADLHTGGATASSWASDSAILV
jgi:Ca2+-binding RTX toxin-like protein